MTDINTTFDDIKIIGKIGQPVNIEGIITNTDINTTFNDIKIIGKIGQPVDIEGIITNTDINITVEQMASIYADKHYIHTQIKSSNVWIIQHNLDKYPSVIIADSSNNVVIGDIVFIDKNSIIVSFMAEFSGKAYLN